MDIKNIGAQVSEIKKKYKDHAKSYLEEVLLDDKKSWQPEKKEEPIVEEKVEMKNMYDDSDPFLSILVDTIKGKKTEEKKVPIVEADDELDGTPAEDTTDVPTATSDEAKDPVDQADEVLKDIDLDELDTEAKIELINSIIDNIQNTVDDDDQFSDAMNKIQDIIDGFVTNNEEEADVEEPSEPTEEPTKEELPPPTPPTPAE